MAVVARQLRVERLGLVAYGPALALQEARHQDILAADADDTLFLLQHHPVITSGRNTAAGHVLVPQAVLAARGVEYHETGRGGDVTFHGPGQVVGYPIVHLQEHERDIKAYVHALEEALIGAVADFGITATRLAGRRGIWVGNDKLAAIGVRIARWVTLHGFALNVSVDLADFGLIVPCGLHDCGVTSLAKLLGEAPPLAVVEDRLVQHVARVLRRQAVEAPASSERVSGAAPRASAGEML